ncbi:MAG: MBL fold metallo-hydrolase [Pseudomonadota bacterium]
MSLTVTILGCGSSGGVPRVGNDWGHCDPDEPKNRRTRSSILVEKSGEGGTTSVLVDTSPDLREQLLRAEVKRLDAVLYTHDHADQTHGIDDLRAIAYRMRGQLPVYMDAHTEAHVVDRFRYCFEKPEGRVHPAILALQPLIAGGHTIHIDGPGGSIRVDVVEASHGPTPTLIFVFDAKLAYGPDVWEISEDGLAALQDLDVWICDALRYNKHPTHAHVDKALSWMARTRTRRAILTNLHIDLDYNALASELPAIAEPSYDGMELNV